jgi:hypothetical protein
MSNIDIFNNKINSFLSKYYKNQILRGLILSVLFFLFLLLIISSLEYYSWFGNRGRLFLFLFSLISVSFIFYYFLLIPLFRYLGIFKRLTYKHTADILSKQIPELKDYIHNIIELKNLETADNELINAALNQKINYVSKFDFLSVITFGNIKPLLKYLLAVLAVYVFMFITKPEIIVDGSDRLIHFNTNYTQSNYYTVFVDTSKLTLKKGDDLVVDVTVNGKILPSSLSLFISNSEFLMEHISSTKYRSVIKSVNNDFSFVIKGDKYLSQSYNVKVIDPPFLKNFSVSVDYPGYTGIENKIFTGISNLKVAQGSKLKFTFNCLYTDNLYINTDSVISRFYFVDAFVFDTVVMHSFIYSIDAINSNLKQTILSNSVITVIPDLYPEIKVQIAQDDINKKLFYFKGIISDDYGFSNLYFVYNNKQLSVPFSKNTVEQEFYFVFEFADSLKNYNYYFQVFDNDMVNGFKSSKTEIFKFSVPDYKELISEKNEMNKKIQEKIEKTLLMAQEYSRDIDFIKQKLNTENLSSFEKKQLLDELQQKQQSINDLLKDIAGQNRKKNNMYNSFSQEELDIMKKQEEIQSLMDKVFDDELKKLLEELQKLTQQENKELMNKDLDKLQMNYEQLSKELDKNLELLKKFEMERDLLKISDELSEIAKNQKKLSESENFDKADSLLKNDINKLSELSQQYDSIYTSNKNLEKPFNLDSLQNQFSELKQNMQKSQDALNEQNSGDDKSNEPNDNKSNDGEHKKQKPDFDKNSEDAQKLADAIQMMMQSNEEKENAENAETLRQILENLFYFSFTQESIYTNFQSLSTASAAYYDNIKNQQNLQNDFTIIYDSLYALSKRTPYLGNHINKKVSKIRNLLFDVNFELQNSNYSKIYIPIRNILTESNDLILLLTESLKNMENSGGMGGKNSKSKPKKNKKSNSQPSLSDLRKTQESIKSQLKSMINQMKSGQQQGKKSSRQRSQMLAQQEIFQQRLNQLRNSGSVGSDATKKLDEINKLIEQNKRDIINNNMNRQSMIRQEKILTRLLEAENAERQRELDKKRESEEALTNYEKNNNKNFDNFIKQNNFNDILNKNSLKLNYFYQNKYREYINNIK